MVGLILRLVGPSLAGAGGVSKRVGLGCCISFVIFAALNISLEQQDQAAEESLPAPFPFPPACSEEQKRSTALVSPSRDTACPDATWLLLNNSDASSVPRNEYPILFEPSRGRDPLAIFIGCNKGIDAVDTLRFLTQDPQYDKSTWLKALGIGPAASKGACGAGIAEQTRIYPEKYLPRPGKLHCVEALPANFQMLHRAAAKMVNWTDTFVVHHAAAADADGVIPFPNGRPGSEALGIEACQNNPQICVNVTMTTLDSFFHDKVEEGIVSDRLHHPATPETIDFLSIDVEGYDPAVLRGGTSTLKITKYLEFEAHGVGLWRTTRLSDVIASLREQDFLCYWAGKGGKLWRLTDCMPDLVPRQWSNVACANVILAPHLAKHMEDVYSKTIGG